MPEKKLEDASGLLERFATAESLDERLATLAELIKSRALHAARADVRLASGVQHLGSLAADSRDPEPRMRAIAALARIGTVKSLTAVVDKILVSALTDPLAPLTTLKDPDDRYYVARALHSCSQVWIIEYAASGIVEERQAETSRQELMGVLFTRLGTLAEIFRLIGAALVTFRPETKNPGDSVAKRLERILAALRPQTVSVLIEPGPDAGERLKDMLQSAFAGAGAPESPDVAAKVIEEIGGLIHDIARTQISLVAEPALYGALDIPKAWFSPPEWRYIAEKSPSLQLVTRDIREAITLLAKQGTTDSELVGRLATASGSRESAAKIAASIADRHPEIDDVTRAWLRSGGRSQRRASLGAFEESRELSADPLLATLMTDADQLREALAGISDDTRTELRLLEPAIGQPLDTMMTRSRAVLSSLDALAEKRGLRRNGHKGELVEYSDAVHELIGGHAPGVRKVKIVQPMILREGADGVVSVVRRALVERT